MDEDKLVTDLIEIDNILINGLMNEHTFLILQVDHNSPKQGPVCWGNLAKINKNEVEIKIRYLRKQDFLEDIPITILCHKTKQYFQSSEFELKDGIFITPYPEKLVKGDIKFLAELRKSITEEDQEECLVRSGETGRTDGEKKYVELMPDRMLDEHPRFLLSGLNTEGLNLLTLHLTNFEIDKDVEIYSINNKKLPNPIKGKVESIQLQSTGFIKVKIKYKAEGKDAA